MVYRVEIGRLLDEYTDLSNAVTLVEDELVLLPKYKASEWKGYVDKFLKDYDNLVELIAYDNNKFAVFYQETVEASKNRDAAYGAETFSYGYGSRTGKAKPEVKNNNEIGIAEPFDGFFEYNRRLNECVVVLEWLKSQYDVVDCCETTNFKHRGDFGKFHFDFTGDKPTTVFYDNYEVNMPPAHLTFLYIMLDLCYWEGKEVDVATIKKRIELAGYTPDKCNSYQSEVNKILARNKHVALTNFIRASLRKGYKTLQLP